MADPVLIGSEGPWTMLPAALIQALYWGAYVKEDPSGDKSSLDSVSLARAAIWISRIFLAAFLVERRF